MRTWACRDAETRQLVQLSSKRRMARIPNFSVLVRLVSSHATRLNRRHFPCVQADMGMGRGSFSSTPKGKRSCCGSGRSPSNSLRQADQALSVRIILVTPSEWHFASFGEEMMGIPVIFRSAPSPNVLIDPLDSYSYLRMHPFRTGGQPRLATYKNPRTSPLDLAHAFYLTSPLRLSLSSLVCSITDHISISSLLKLSFYSRIP